MKKLIALIALSMISAGAQAGDQEMAEIAIRKLLALNPLATAASPELGEAVRVSELIGGSMLSQIYEDGIVNLSVVTNKCEYAGRSTMMDCQLVINSSDRRLDANGAYVPAEDMTESSIIINYRMDANTTTILPNSVRYDIAG